MVSKIDEKELLKLIERGESETVEFKETISAFSNTISGIILIGISDFGKVIGVTIGKNTIENLAGYIKRNTDPQIYPLIKVEELENKKIISIEVSESKEKPVFFKRHAYKRVGKTNLELNSSEMRKLAKESRGKVYWDEQVCEDVGLNDIDEEKVRWFIGEARKQRGLKLSETLPIKDVLMKLKLSMNEKLTNACALLFSKEPKILQSEVKCIRFSGNEPVKPYIDFQTLNGNVFDLIDRAEDFVLRNVKKSIWLVPGQVQREEKYEYPPDAIREAITNAVVHRDYESPSKVQVRVFDDYIEIWNPGELPEGWTVEKLKEKHESIPRNPLLFKQLFWVKYVEDVGGGTLDMIRQCKEWELPEPEFEFTGTSLVVTFRKSKLTKEYLETLGLNERQKKAIEYLKEHNRITKSEYMKLTGISKTPAFKDIDDLLRKKLIIRKGVGRSTYYVLKESVSKRPKKNRKKTEKYFSTRS